MISFLHVEYLSNHYKIGLIGDVPIVEQLGATLIAQPESTESIKFAKLSSKQANHQKLLYFKVELKGKHYDMSSFQFDGELINTLRLPP